MHTYATSQWVPYPVELVFAFFANPNNLPHLTPKGQKARLESLHLAPAPARPLAVDPAHRFQSAAAGVGSELQISMRLLPGLPMRTRWLVRITEFTWNEYFQDEMIRGPFALWKHTHRIVREEEGDAATDGTRVTDELTYQLPLGPLGSVAHALFVRRQIEATFAFRQRRLLEILPVAARQATRRQ
ncbi:MAG TPA: SRPBCC family protein [Acidobacteriaceae bacterium]